METRRFEMTKLEERVAPTTLHFGGITIDYNVSGNTVSGSVSAGGHTYSGSISLSQLQTDLSKLLHSL
jgi:hypothetical protein